MSKAKRTSIEVQGTSIAILNRDNQDYISLTVHRSASEYAGTFFRYQQLDAQSQHDRVSRTLGETKQPQFLNLSNSRGLKPRPAATTSSCRLSAGSRLPKPLELSPNQVVTVGLSRTARSPLNSHLGSLRNSNSTSSRNSSASRMMKTIGSSSAGTYSAPCPRSTTASTRMRSKRPSFRPPSPSPRPSSFMPTRPICSTSRSSAKPPNSGETPILTLMAMSVITRRWSNLWSSPIWKVSTPCSFAKAFPSQNVCSS